MRKLVVAAIFAGTFVLASPAFAGPGQCYDAYGRPIGPVYDTDHPNYNWINSVLARGGSCTGVVSPSTPGYRGYRGNYRYYGYERPRYRSYTPYDYYDGYRN